MSTGCSWRVAHPPVDETSPSAVVTASVAVDDPTVSAEVVVLAGPAGTHIDLARHHLGEGRSIVSVSDSLGDALALLDLDAEASARGVTVIAGAGFSPGLTCLLARHAARDLDVVDEIHVARSGTGGPGVRPPAPSRAGGHCARLARPWVAASIGGFRARAVLVP